MQLSTNPNEGGKEEEEEEEEQQQQQPESTEVSLVRIESTGNEETPVSQEDKDPPPSPEKNERSQEDEIVDIAKRQALRDGEFNILFRKIQNLETELEESEKTHQVRVTAYCSHACMFMHARGREEEMEEKIETT